MSTTPTGPRHDGHDEQHPVLSEKEDAAQRGTDPAGAVGATERPSGDLAEGWTPSDHLAHEAGELAAGIGREHRPRREDVYPYLLLRAASPGDRGARPVWPPVPCWQSPDILLMDAASAGPFDPSQLVGSPTAGRRYRVFVRVWNLGLLPAVGVHVRAWFVDPGFFGGGTGPAYQPQLIGGAMVTLEDRTRPGAVAVVELDRTWDIPESLTGHECLLASVSCPLDPWSGVLDANADRHVGQRNLTVLAGDDDAKQLLWTLGSRVTGTLELLHGGAAVGPLLRGVLGDTETELGVPERLLPPSPKALRHGVATPAGQHLATLLRTRGGWLLADSERVVALATELGMLEKDAEKPQRGRRRAADAPDVARLAQELAREHAERVGVLVDAEPGDALLEGLVRLWDVGDLTARGLAAALAEGGPSAHLLQLAHTDRERQEVGGYSLALLG
ncbi:hypothetical protein [Arthrobacter sp. NEB 688]|uniref:hypothetical protein n=1 Tax=Arthrobacter sp. NEB 688 TaxID=904039 RepID=UPI0015674702|nr:hypothetical protein [Arthrobacter sp. NEB 688]QKE82624.1 hypothetical protein HL663_00730 [Arthrobacter sp. NEB 688]